MEDVAEEFEVSGCRERGRFPGQSSKLSPEGDIQIIQAHNSASKVDHLFAVPRECPLWHRQEKHTCYAGIASASAMNKGVVV